MTLVCVGISLTATMLQNTQQQQLLWPTLASSCIGSRKMFLDWEVGLHPRTLQVLSYTYCHFTTQQVISDITKRWIIHFTLIMTRVMPGTNSLRESSTNLQSSGRHTHVRWSLYILPDMLTGNVINMILQVRTLTFSAFVLYTVEQLK